MAQGSSRCDSTRVISAKMAMQKALTTGSSATNPTSWKLGWMISIAPRKPTPQAVYRRQPMVSFRKMLERIVRMIGSTKKMAIASATDMYFSVATKLTMEMVISAPRTAW
jgi:hypothetical protein